jgi:nucleoside-diphosphate-sugar epimerase
VIHLGFVHDFSRFQEVCEIDRRAIEALGGELAGSNRPLVVTAGLFVTPGSLTTEDDEIPSNSPVPRVSEQTAMPMAAHGVRVSAVRLPQVHDAYKQGLVTYLIGLARERGVSAYVGDGLNRWPTIHVLDAAPLYRSALEKGAAGARYHAVAEEGVPLREIAEAIGRGLGIPVVSKSPEEAAGHFGWLGFFAGMDGPASSALTQQRLGWRPMQNAGMIEDLDHMHWSAV